MTACTWRLPGLPSPFDRCGRAVVDPRSRNDLTREDLCYHHDKVSARMYEMPMPAPSPVGPHGAERPRQGIEPSQVAGVSDETRQMIETFAKLGYTAGQCRMILASSQMRGRRRAG